MQKKIKFSKMHGLGNDFMMINTIAQPINTNELPIATLANRHTGIGFDQLLLIGPSEKADFSCRIFNSDGGEAEQCGNGMRCVGHFIREKALSTKNPLRIETKAGIIEIENANEQRFRVNMGMPRDLTTLSLNVQNKKFNLYLASFGNPHAVFIVDDVINSAAVAFGAAISTHTAFPRGTNVGFMEIVNRNKIRLRTYERGTGETLACGSNSCAAVVSGIKQNLLDSKVEVEVALGSLEIEWRGEGQPVYMTGKAANVFDGEITL